MRSLKYKVAIIGNGLTARTRVRPAPYTPGVKIVNPTGYSHSDFCSCGEERRCAGCQTWTKGRYCPRCEEMAKESK